MNTRILSLTTAVLGSLFLLGCNNDSNNNSNPSPTKTGDVLILTSNGMIGSINRDQPEMLVSNLKITNLQSGEQLIGIDHRPKDGKLYAVGTMGNIYTLNPQTGRATWVSKLVADPADTTDGNAPFDKITGNPDLMTVNFNPAADRLRVIGNDGQNLRINVDTGATITDGNISLGGESVAIIAAAYTNAFAGTASTRLFSIDQNTDRIYLQNANAGTLGNSAMLASGVDVEGGGGFDIDPINNVGYAALKVAGTYQLHHLNVAAVGSENAAVVESKNLPNLFQTSGIRGLALASTADSGAHTYGLSANNQLIHFMANTPNSVKQTNITGLKVAEKIIGIDFRFKTTTDKSGMLYGLSDQSNLYTINTQTGMATLQSSLKAATGDDNPFTMLLGTSFAVDFNPAADRLRVISNTGQSLRINVDTGDTITDGDLNGIDDAVVSAAAYTNSFQTPIPMIGTELFNLDQGNQLLVKQSPPNDGVLNSIGALGINLGMDNGFDIAGGDNGFALATVSGMTGPSVLYRIDLNSDTTIMTPRARLAISVDGTPNLAASTIGSTTTPQLIDLAIMLK
ncbi:DUF4394 domain-containing protein [Acinetobacter sp. NIPH 1852]|uniref:DUF4394 domain-containing protein n=1 Tax=Acinetobacter sp. NIPH 1852 TaxID=2923428 RepID=UPI001F4A806D|nr:DUF4394 domain-containing protein [Acinetobacter sp. NIPH 1852]MCH7307996.1 DUF4394 domain-containing protein [Acinetobacter sp. NIPH 1852]